MKRLTLIMDEPLKQDAADLFRSMKQIQGFTFSRTEGHGAASERSALLSDRDRVVGYTPHARVEMLLEDHDVDGVLAALSKSRIGLNENSIYWVTAVERFGRLE